MSQPDPSRDKSKLRGLAREQRRAISPTRRPLLDQRIREHLLHGVRRGNFKTLAAFLTFDNEPDLLPALDQFAIEGRAIALPVIASKEHGAMQMHEWRPGVEMRANAFGIMEPAGGTILSRVVLELVFLPLVAYDKSGTRLGMGGGYYDRWLTSPDTNHGPYRVGVAYSAQCTSSLPRDEWDVPLDAIVNEHGWFIFPL